MLEATRPFGAAPHVTLVSLHGTFLDRHGAATNVPTREPTRRETPDGTWVYMPAGPPPDYFNDSSTNERPHRRRPRRSRRQRHGPDEEPNDDPPHEEQADETPTNDPVVNVTPMTSLQGVTPPRTASLPPPTATDRCRAGPSSGPC